jgi:hypothetical protein
MSSQEFNFEDWYRRFPDHWDEAGRPEINSTWRSRNHPMMRVRVAGRDGNVDVETMVYWDGDLDGLRLLFTYEPTERWNIDNKGLVCGPAGIDPQGRWRRATATLHVVFDRPMFGGPDTWHMGMEGENLPFFEPVDDWDQ